MSETELNRRLDHLGRVVSRDQLKREKKREKEMGEASTFGGSVMVIIAAVLAVMGVLSPDKWWLLFVALGLGIGGAKQIELARRRDKQLGPRGRQQDPVTAKADR